MTWYTKGGWRQPEERLQRRPDLPRSRLRRRPDGQEDDRVLRAEHEVSFGCCSERRDPGRFPAGKRPFLCLSGSQKPRRIGELPTGENRRPGPRRARIVAQKDKSNLAENCLLFCLTNAQKDYIIECDKKSMTISLRSCGQRRFWCAQTAAEGRQNPRIRCAGRRRT